MDFSIIADNAGVFAEGMLVTVELVGCALIAGLALAVPLALAANARSRPLRGAVFLFSYCFRGTPLLVQLFMIYYGLGQFEWIRGTPLWGPVLSQPYWCALIAFTLNTAAYTTEILRGAIANTPRGEVEAARACGMSRALMLRRVVLPNAFRRALPAYGNEVIFMLHGSAVASVITLVDITGAAQLINARYYSPYEAFITAAVLYMALTFAVVFVFRCLERRWLAHLRPRVPRRGRSAAGAGDGKARDDASQWQASG
ncbi:ABC transporter permease [Arhodomonas sp. AD133]|uniref:ABC transporter permease n=1 Tax=Arhodomonas sp. AD133 TaxID=3415009 RepID=UPI003EBE45AA